MFLSPLASDRRRIGLQSAGGTVTVCTAAHKLFSILCRLACSCAPRSLTSPHHLPSLRPCGSAMIKYRDEGGALSAQCSVLSVYCSVLGGHGAGTTERRGKGGESRKKQGWRANRMSRARALPMIRSMSRCASGQVASHRLERSRYYPPPKNNC
jgi:hypothetical protein